MSISRFVLLMCALLAACRRPTSEPRNEASVPVEVRGVSAPLVLHPNVPAEVRQGTPVTFRVSLVNRGSSPVGVTLRGQAEAWFDIVVRDDENGAVMWWRMDRMASLSIGEDRTLAAGDSIVFAETWDLRTRYGSTVPPGTYQVLLKLSASRSDTLSAISAGPFLMRVRP